MSATFRSVRNNRNAQLFFLGMLASNVGTWVQFTAVAIIVDRLTGKTTAIGILSALQFGPMLVLGAWAGAVADRVDRRKMTILTQTGLALQAAALMQKNPRYIFFREIDGPAATAPGPVGAQGVSLTPMRSLAVDTSVLPLGAPLWLDTVWPPGAAQAGEPLRLLMIAQDTGGAIKGAVRGDFFWGTGEAALDQAGAMKEKGRYYLLLPKTVAERRAAS